MERSHQIKSLVFSFVAVAGALTVSVVACELVSQALPRFDSLPYHNQLFSPYFASPSDYLPITLSPKMELRHETNEFSVLYRTNKLGFRGAYPVNLDKGSGVRRLLFLGDSFTLGWGVEDHETFAVRVQELLTQPSGGIRFESINAAYRAGYSADAYYAFMKREGWKLKPDIVVVAHYANDIRDMNSNVWLETDNLAAPIRIRTLRRYASWDGHIASGFLWNERIPLLRESRMFMALAQVLNRYTSLGATPELNSMKDIVLNRPVENSQHLPLIMRAFDVLAEKHSFEILHVLIPPRKQIEGNAEISIMRKAILGNSVFPVIDLSNFLKTCHYFKKDGHFNRIGHAFVGDIIADFIREQRVPLGMDSCNSSLAGPEGRQQRDDGFCDSCGDSATRPLDRGGSARDVRDQR